MLVLSRKKDECIVIKVGDEIIELTVIDVRQSRARLGFVAGEKVSILRKEIVDKCQNTQAH